MNPRSVERALSISDRTCIMEHGIIVHHESGAKLVAETAIQWRVPAVG